MELKQTPGAAVPGFRTVLILLGVVILAVLRTNIGISEHAHAPIGDESNRLQGAHQLFRAHKWSKSVYDDCYIWVFRHVTADPIEASFKLREAASILSTAGIFLLLSSVRGVGAPGAFLAALLWNLNLINAPVVQKQASTVFAFGLASLAVAVRLRFPNRWVRIFYVPAAMLAGFVRPEYHLLWLLCIPYELSRFRWRKLRKAERWIAVTTGCIAAVAIAVLCANRHDRRDARLFFDGMDRYIFLGFSDRYSQFYVASHPDAGFDPMVEHVPFMERTFHGAHGFTDAIRDNPPEVLRFVLRNAFSNLKSLPDLLDGYSLVLPGADSARLGPAASFFLAAGRWLLIGWICFGIFWLAREILRKGADLEQGFLLFSLAAVSSVAFFLLIPRARYWITLEPLIYCGSAALASRIAARLRLSTQIALGAALFLSCSYPVFLNTGPDYSRDLILALRSKTDEVLRRPGSSTPGKTGILGFYAQPLAAMANPDALTPIGFFSFQGKPDFSGQVAASGAGFLVIDDSLRKSGVYAAHRDFFTAFLAAPASFGYEAVIQAPHFNGTVIYERLQDQPRAGAASGRFRAPGLFAMENFAK